MLAFCVFSFLVCFLINYSSKSGVISVCYNSALFNCVFMSVLECDWILTNQKKKISDYHWLGYTSLSEGYSSETSFGEFLLLLGTNCLWYTSLTSISPMWYLSPRTRSSGIFFCLVSLKMSPNYVCCWTPTNPCDFRVSLANNHWLTSQINTPIDLSLIVNFTDWECVYKVISIVIVSDWS